MTKSAVVNKETTIVENIIMADPSDSWPDSNSFLVLVPDNLPVNFNDTYVEPNFYNSDGNIIEPIPAEPAEEIIDVVEETTTEPAEPAEPAEEIIDVTEDVTTEPTEEIT